MHSISFTAFTNHAATASDTTVPLFSLPAVNTADGSSSDFFLPPDLWQVPEPATTVASGPLESERGSSPAPHNTPLTAATNAVPPQFASSADATDSSTGVSMPSGLWGEPGSATTLLAALRGASPSPRGCSPAPDSTPPAAATNTGQFQFPPPAADAAGGSSSGLFTPSELWEQPTTATTLWQSPVSPQGGFSFAPYGTPAAPATHTVQVQFPSPAFSAGEVARGGFYMPVAPMECSTEWDVQYATGQHVDTVLPSAAHMDAINSTSAASHPMQTQSSDPAAQDASAPDAAGDSSSSYHLPQNLWDDDYSTVPFNPAASSTPAAAASSTPPFTDPGFNHPEDPAWVSR